MTHRLPRPPGQMKRCWRGGNGGEAKRFAVAAIALFLFLVFSLCVYWFACLLCFDFFLIFIGGTVEEGGDMERLRGEQHWGT